jgi:TolB-like protein
VRCAIEVQQGMLERNAEVPAVKRIEFRVGINLGDVMVEGRDLYGDGVNIAARLEGLAEPGGICISETVLNHTRGKITLDADDLGDQALKNIVQPIHVYRIIVDPRQRRATSQPQARALALPDKPSIAILPFQNMSGDPEQEYFADGIVEEIITALSRFRSLFVIARNSSFTYKRHAVDVKLVGRELGARYVLEGSVRKAANRVRITGQLIDTLTGVHLWADRFEGALEEIFDLQDQVTASVVGAIAPQLEKAEIERAKRKPTESLDAYDYYLRGMARIYQYGGREANADALRLFHQAIELDPEFASAYGMAAICYDFRRASGWMTDPANDVTETARLARRAVELGKDDAVALATSGRALAYVVRDLDAGAAFVDRALLLNPNLAWAWAYGGWMKIWLGEPEVAIERLARAMRLSPIDPLTPGFQHAMAHAHFFAGRNDEASSWGRRRCGMHRTCNHHYVSTPHAMRSPGGWSRHRNWWHGCGSSIPRCAFPISETCWGRTGGPKTSRGTKRACGKRGCQSDRNILWSDITPDKEQETGLLQVFGGPSRAGVRTNSAYPRTFASMDQPVA